MLIDGWKVVKKIEPDPLSTGGNFSIQYHVQRDDGRMAFCKALNLSVANHMPDPARITQALVEGFNFERDILGKCRSQKLSRVVLSIGDGVVQIPEFAGINVNYIIFELAEFDVRKALDLSDNLGVASKIRMLHHIAAGVRQLHGIRVAHQDIKPSNVLLFATADASTHEGKLGDLGRASDASRLAPHDELSIAGDPGYAPPEQLYHATPSSFDERRIACDLYQLGSLAVFMFTGASMNGLLQSALPAAQNWNNWGDTYEEVMPYVRDAFGRAMRRVADSLPALIREDLRLLIASLCDPDPTKRGYGAKASAHASGRYSLERAVAALNLLQIRVETGVIRRASK